MTWAPSFPSPRELRPLAISFKQCIVIMPELVRGEKRDLPVRALLDPGDQLVSVSLVVAADDKGDYDLVAWIEPDPDPLVTIDGLEPFDCREARFLFLTNDQSSSNWHSSR